MQPMYSQQSYQQNIQMVPVQQNQMYPGTQPVYQGMYMQYTPMLMQMGMPNPNGFIVPMNPFDGKTGLEKLRLAENIKVAQSHKATKVGCFYPTDFMSNIEVSTLGHNPEDFSLFESDRFPEHVQCCGSDRVAKLNLYTKDSNPDLNGAHFLSIDVPSSGNEKKATFTLGNSLLGKMTDSKISKGDNVVYNLSLTSTGHFMIGGKRVYTIYLAGTKSSIGTMEYEILESGVKAKTFGRLKLNPNIAFDAKDKALLTASLIAQMVITFKPDPSCNCLFDGD